MSDPIAGAELTYQRRAATRPKWFGRLILRLGYGVALGTALIVFWSEFASAVLQTPLRPTTDVFNALSLYMLIVALTDHGMVFIKAMGAAAVSITRERQSGTWDLLLMTGIDARRVVRGKWRGVVGHLWPRLLYLIPLRAGAAVLLGSAVSQSTAATVYYAIVAEAIPPEPLNILAVVPVVALFTFAGAALAAAVGVMTSAVARRPATALALGAALYLALIIGGIVTVSLLARLADGQSSQARVFVTSALGNTQVALADNGIMLSASLASYTIRYPQGSEMARYHERHAEQIAGSSLVALAVTLALIGLATWICLWLAERFAIRAGALPSLPARTPQRGAGP